ncbi:MAG: hypothetical protein RIC18_10385 [Hoeflea sp.]|uniref:hypothetical protein n=1 Tax=Hoeflea sp. TaxID=1940281 RepID=UPI0032EE1A24
MIAKRFLVLALTLLAGGCLSVTPGGLMEASRFDPLTSNPAGLGAGVAVPQTIRLSNGDVAIVMSYTVEPESRPRISERFALDVAEAGALPDAPPPQSGERIYVASLSRDDAFRMRATQARILALRATGVEGVGAFSVSVGGGCTVSKAVETMPVRTFIRTRQNDPFVQLTTRRDLLRVLPADQRQALRENIRECEGVAGGDRS